MDWQIRGLNISLSKPLKKHTESKLIAPLRKFKNAVNKVVIRFQDADLANHHSEVSAKALVILSNGRVIEIEQTNRNYYDAINQLADRIKLNVSKNLNKQRDKQRRASTRRVGNLFKRRSSN
ncbi:Sigma 54 modulation protein / S30EA ribosomal protein [Poriferisphaera corsica]|uniref:Sigma 54 modulation protein / S30EA ribosomal protein n=1 Tax=Poriferisphaera corsica TaxID=2528020 RepID=A0A517YVH7_9BACT|nr:HPF/RaiA family ribosome-associated protein [Poriferisphaera corsica]QDU34237.1 Sigma 54 modulation protein / S30EA ribosomal protein [Poriferisphaera corsica]